MVKILFEIFDILSPDSRRALQRLLIDRWNIFCASHQPAASEELARFATECWRPEERPGTPASASPAATIGGSGSIRRSNGSVNDDEDRFLLIHSYVNRADPGVFKLVLKARFAVYRVSTSDAPAPPLTPQHPSAATAEKKDTIGGDAAAAAAAAAVAADGDGDGLGGCCDSIAPEDAEQHAAQLTCGSLENEEALDELRLLCDAPIVRLLLSLRELPDTTLWLVVAQAQEAAFVSQVLRRLPVAVFFEGPSRLWRLLDVSTTTAANRHAELRRRTNSKAHETIVMVTESFAAAHAASRHKNWVGVYLMGGSALNRNQSIENFTSSFDSPVSSRNSQVDLSANAASPLSPATPSLVGAAVADGPSAPGSFATARGIAQLGRVIVGRVPELREALRQLNINGGSGPTSPMLLSTRNAPRSEFCVCNCFWTGVYTGVAATTAAVLTVGVGLLVVSATLKTFGVKGKRSSSH